MNELNIDSIVDNIIINKDKVDIISLNNLVEFLKVEPLISKDSSSQKLEPMLKPEDKLYNDDNSINIDTLKKVISSFNLARYFLSRMHGLHFVDLYKHIEEKYPELLNPALIVDETNNNTRTRTITIGENGKFLKFVFDIEILVVKEYNVATIHELKLNNVDKLNTNFRKHQLYKSTGTSRGIGHAYGEDESYEIIDKWFPFNGAEKSRINKSEDNFESIFNLILRSNNLEQINKINEILPEIPNLLKYKRLVNESYTISSYLLDKFNYLPGPLTDEQKTQHTLELGKNNKALLRLIGLPDPDSKFYYQKYLKYKAKYIELKNKN
jgi:hypothetical protein